MDGIGTTTNGSKARSAKSATSRSGKAAEDKPTKTERRNGFSFPDFFDLFRGRR